jgi:hypothetical protein
MLGYNQIRALPTELAQLQFLKILDLTANKVVVVPPEVAEIPDLQEIQLSLNPVLESIDKAARKGHKVLLEFLRSDQYDAEYYEVHSCSIFFFLFFTFFSVLCDVLPCDISCFHGLVRSSL